MFTGIIEEIGEVQFIGEIPGGKRIQILSQKVLEQIKIGDSISVNGICLTVTKHDRQSFTCEAVGATLSKTTLNNLRVRDSVNLERALLFSDRVGGHFVQGHINGIGKVNQIIKLGDNYSVDIIVPESLRKYIVNEGSIAVEGISLTVAELNGSHVIISVIPHTWNNTNLNKKHIGDSVNIETDIIAKYIENLVVKQDDSKNKFTDTWFKELGY